MTLVAFVLTISIAIYAYSYLMLNKVVNNIQNKHSKAPFLLAQLLIVSFIFFYAFTIYSSTTGGLDELYSLVIDSLLFLGSVFVLTVVMTIYNLLLELSSLRNQLSHLTDKESSISIEKELNDRTEELMESKIDLEKQQKALLNVLDDLSEEKEYSESQSKYLIETIGEGLIVTDDGGEINYVNKKLIEMLGYSEDELVGQLVTDVISAYDMKGEELDKTMRSDAAMVTAKNQETKLKLEKKDGEQISVVVNASPINVQGQYKGVIRVIHDVTEEVKLQQQKDDFFSIASHELRTPLTVISGNLDIILQGYGKSTLSKDDRDLLVDTVSASDRLIHMVNDFLNVSRIDQGRIKVNPMDIDACTLAEDVVKELSPLAEGKNISLTFECSRGHKSITADPNLVKEIMINLIGNSIKFTREGGVEITHQVVGDMLHIKVIDSGAGIAKDQQGKLFQRFEQAMGRTLNRQAGGTGLGLYISREFARKMGGDLILEKSVSGKGSVFTVSLPLTKSAKKNKQPLKKK